MKTEIEKLAESNLWKSERQAKAGGLVYCQNNHLIWMASRHLTGDRCPICKKSLLWLVPGYLPPCEVVE